MSLLSTDFEDFKLKNKHIGDVTMVIPNITYTNPGHYARTAIKNTYIRMFGEECFSQAHPPGFHKLLEYIVLELPIYSPDIPKVCYSSIRYMDDRNGNTVIRVFLTHKRILFLELFCKKS